MNEEKDKQNTELSEPPKKKTALGIAGKILSWLILVLAVVLLIFSLTARITGKPFQIFGYSFHVVVTDSMTGEIEPGEFIVAKSIPIDEAQIGDNVLYKAKSGPVAGNYIVHKVVQKYEEDGHTVIRTQGVKFGAPVDEPVTEILGKYVWKSSAIGAVFVFLSKPWNILFLAGILLLAYVAYRIVKNILKINREKDGDSSKNDSSDS